jgi:hypothetical protein
MDTLLPGIEGGASDSQINAMRLKHAITAAVIETNS